MVLSEAQKTDFWRDGCLVVENAVTPDQLAAMRGMMADWAEESRAHTKPYGPPTIDGRPRFDMGAEHSAEQPALRRINNPSDLYGPFQDAMENSAMTEMVNELIGPNLKFHHCRIGVKLHFSCLQNENQSENSLKNVTDFQMTTLIVLGLLTLSKTLDF